VYLCPAKGDIIEYLRVRMCEDETPDAMNPSLEAEILVTIPNSLSEMCVGEMVLSIKSTIAR